jgi:hypothetical protein
MGSKHTGFSLPIEKPEEDLDNKQEKSFDAYDISYQKFVNRTKQASLLSLQHSWLTFLQTKG